MFGHESKLKVKEVLVYSAEQEIAIERLRQILSAMRDFEPYTAFKRIDRHNTGYIDAESLTQFQRENGYRELEPSDFKQMIRYFDLDGDNLLNYHDFLQLLLPCDDAYLRAAVSQRPNNELPRNELLPMRVERALSQLIFKEVRMHLKADLMKRALENSYDFSIQKAFRAIDDWTYNYIDSSNLKRFLRSMGHLATKQEIVAILRRFDMDGDAKINMAEFALGMKSSLTVFAKKGASKRPRSSATISKLVTSSSASKLGLKQQANTPRRAQMTPRTQAGGDMMQRRSSKGARNQRPRTGKASRVSKPSLTSYSGSLMPREASASRQNRQQVYQNQQRQERQEQQYHNRSRDGGMSPSNLNKSVSFSQSVKVREFPSNSNRRQKSKTGKATNGGNSMPQRRLEYDYASPNRMDEGYSSEGGSSSARQHINQAGYNESQSHNRYNLMGGSPLVSKRHGSTSNLHEPSPGRMAMNRNESQRSHHSGSQRNNVQRNDASPSPLIVSHNQARVTDGPRCDQTELDEFIKVLKDIIFAEREVESAKIELALKSDFNIVDKFNMFDMRGGGNVTQQDLKDGLMQHLGFMDFTNDDIFMLMRRFDRANCGVLTFQDFNKMILPFSREYACLVTDRADFYTRRSRDPSTYFNSDTRYEMQAFWAVLVRTERMMEALRCRLNSRPYINYRDLFEYCARSRTGLMLACDLRDVLAENGFYATERELHGLMYRLDRDQDSCVSFQDFMDELAPKLH